MSLTTTSSNWSTGVSGDFSLGDSTEMMNQIKDAQEKRELGKRDNTLREEREVQDTFLSEKLKALEELSSRATVGTYLSFALIVGLMGYGGYMLYQNKVKKG